MKNDLFDLTFTDIVFVLERYNIYQHDFTVHNNRNPKDQLGGLHDPNSMIIYLDNRNNYPSEKRLIILHELAHAVLWIRDDARANNEKYVDALSKHWYKQIYTKEYIGPEGILKAENDKT